MPNFDLISLAGIFGVFIMPVIMIIFIVWFKTNQKIKQNKLKAELIAKAIENGQTVPDNLFETKQKKNPLRTGILCLATGVGIALFFVFQGIAEKNYGDIFSGLGIAMIPVFVGIGHLLIHFIDKKQGNDSDK